MNNIVLGSERRVELAGGVDGRAGPSSMEHLRKSTQRLPLRSNPTEADTPLPRAWSVTELRGRHMGRFLVLGLLGRGGMGVVVEAHDETLDRNVALKLLNASGARRSEARLLREAQALARLSHPNVVQVYDIGAINGQTFIAMELVRGRTLRAWARERPPWHAAVALYLQAARGLAAAHHKGLVHRDFKPENCIVDEEGRVRVLDFGLARELVGSDGVMTPADDEPCGLEETDRNPGPFAEDLTRSGVLMGTLGYMSFEQLQGRQADALSDQFSFCASLFEAVYQVRPYPGNDLATLFLAMLSDSRQIAPAGVEAPQKLSRVLWRGLSTDSAKRWPSMDALITELEALVGGRRSRTTIITLGVGLALGTALSFARASPDPCPKVAAVLAGTWDADARQRVEQAFAAHGPTDHGLLPRVLERLDAHASDWATMTREACEATFVTRRQSEAQLEQRTRCLERRRNRFVGTVSALAEAEDSEMLTQAVVLPFRLPSLDPCSEAAADELVATPLDDPDERNATLRRDIDEASTLREAGRIEKATHLAEATLAAARGHADPALLAEALECLGRVQTEGGSMEAARATLEEAIVAAGSARDDATAARAWTSLLFVTTMLGNYDETTHHVLAARAAIERNGDDVVRSWLLNNLGILAAEQGFFDQARAQFEQALALKQAKLGPDHVDVGIAWLNLGTMLSHAGDHRSATAAIGHARSIFASTVGETHPLATYALSSQCFAEEGLGHADEAIALCQRAIERFESVLLDPEKESRTRFALAKALWSRGRAAEARMMARHAARLVTTRDPGNWAAIDEWIESHTPRKESP